MANNFIHGKLSTVQLGGTYFAALTCDWKEGLSDLSDITYTQTGGATFQILLPGYNKASGSLAFVYDSLNQPVLGSQNMIPGVTIALIFSPDGVKLYSLSVISEGLSIAGGPKQGPTACVGNWQSSGSYTRPSS